MPKVLLSDVKAASKSTMAQEHRTAPGMTSILREQGQGEDVLLRNMIDVFCTTTYEFQKNQQEEMNA
jgi:hypothetical protein